MDGVVEDVSTGCERAIAARQQLELIAGGDRRQKGELDRNSAFADKARYRTTVAGIAAGDAVDRTLRVGRGCRWCPLDYGSRRSVPS